jgi:hypothetical protein
LIVSAVTPGCCASATEAVIVAAAKIAAVVRNRFDILILLLATAGHAKLFAS